MSLGSRLVTWASTASNLCLSRPGLTTGGLWLSHFRYKMVHRYTWASQHRERRSTFNLTHPTCVHSSEPQHSAWTRTFHPQHNSRTPSLGSGMVYLSLGSPAPPEANAIHHNRSNSNTPTMRTPEHTHSSCQTLEANPQHACHPPCHCTRAPAYSWLPWGQGTLASHRAFVCDRLTPPTETDSENAIGTGCSSTNASSTEPTTVPDS